MGFADGWTGRGARRRALHDVLLNDVERPGGLTPRFGEGERAAVLLERMRAERRIAGEALQTIAALLACSEAALAEYDRGERSIAELIAALRGDIALLALETRYDEARMLQALGA